jgi:proline dehydrogenase
MQDAADELVTDMMRKYNKEKPIVFNTLQLYRWDRLDYLKSCMKWQKGRVYYWNEVSSWRLHGKRTCQSPKRVSNTNLCIQRATDANYDATVDYMIDHLDGMAIS